LHVEWNVFFCSVSENFLCECNCWRLKVCGWILVNGCWKIGVSDKVLIWMDLNWLILTQLEWIFEGLERILLFCLNLGWFSYFGKKLLSFRKILLSFGKMLLNFGKMLLNFGKMLLNFGKMLLSFRKILLNFGKMLLNFGKMLLSFRKILLNFWELLLNFEWLLLNFWKILLSFKLCLTKK